MPGNSLLDTAHKTIREALRPGGVTIDATAGNGHDTVFLAALTGKKGTVYAFDVQQAALETTRRRLTQLDLDKVVRLHHCSHDRMIEFIPVNHQGLIDAAMFNLGYLPGSDKTLITRPETTLPAITLALELIRPKGIVTIMAYPGHAGGLDETEALENYLTGLPAELFQARIFLSTVENFRAPRLYIIDK